ncbi:cytidylate kinase family protein [Brachybacterium fresconis]|uniref:Glucuronide carrier protein n=1 Tax=Brachybacterium fresconis TaxID=173363 RepID=A0ABS4YJ11_9MICO|nr:cytidylate kinase family protein [Brachybacterium fresconis]MBP2408734.1 glucuronide carrier protein [Brachybacterium fresconis]
MSSAAEATGSRTDLLPRRRVLGYAMGDAANNVAFQMTSLFLMVYMTDIAGVPAAIAGTIYGVTKVWAGVTDLVAGNTVGRRETRHGRLRPWLLWASPFLVVSLVLLFSTPAGLGPMATVAWILLFDAAFQLCYSFVNIPYGSLSAAMTENATDRSRLSGARSIASSITGVVLSLVLSPQFEDTTADGIRLTFTLATVALALIAMILYWVCFRNTREVVPPGTGTLTLRTTLAMVVRNKPLLLLCLGALFLLGGSFTMNAVMMYYARDVVGGAGYFTLLFLAQTIGTIAAATAIPAITEKFGKRIGYVGLALVAVAGLVLIGLTPTGSLPLALLAFLVYGIGFGGTNALMFSMQADTVDYGEWKTGTRAEGGSYSVLSFVRKTGQGIGGALGGAIIGAFGYASGAPEQTEQAVQGIKIAAGWAPAVLCVIAALIIVLYPLGAQEHRSIVQDLRQRRARASVGATKPGGAVVISRDGQRLIATRPVVTINEQYGAGASSVGARVAEQLGVAFAGTRFSSEDLERASSSRPRVLEDSRTGRSLRWLHTFSWPTVEVDVAAESGEAQITSQMVRQNVGEVMKLVKDSGGVVVGRDATMILGDVQGAIHVRMEGEVEDRVARATVDYELTPEVAAQRQVREDRMRPRMSGRLMGWDPAEPTRYHLIIDTSRMSLDEAVEEIVAAVEAQQGE